jgi:aminomethyltransferase
MTDERGGTVDDLMVYRVGDEEYLVVVNAANAESDFAWIAARAEGAAGVRVRDESADVAEVALQGPRAAAVLDGLSEPWGAASALGRFRVAAASVAGVRVLLARTGYTGEDGFEVYVRAADAVGLWRAILRAGEAEGVVPAGLGARDTLRLEAALPLYGQELSREVSPLAAGLGRFVRLERPFVGRDALRREEEAGIPRRVVGLRLLERGVPRTGYGVVDGEGRRVGEVTSGVLSPTLGVPIALALVPAALAEPGTRLAVEIRGRALGAEVVPTPFYKREG